MCTPSMIKSKGLVNTSVGTWAISFIRLSIQEWTTSFYKFLQFFPNATSTANWGKTEFEGYCTTEAVKQTNKNTKEDL